MATPPSTTPTTPMHKIPAGVWVLGFVSLVSGIALLVASTVAGLLWDYLGAAFTFYAGAVFSVLAFAALACKART